MFVQYTLNYSGGAEPPVKPGRLQPGRQVRVPRPAGEGHVGAARLSASPLLSGSCVRFKHLGVQGGRGGGTRSGGADFQFLLPFTAILLTVRFKKLVPDKVIYKKE